MINLLPDSRKQLYQYSVKNKSLFIWVILIASAILGLLAVTTISATKLQNQQKMYANRLSSANSYYAKNNLGDTQKEIKEVQSNITLANKVLTQNIKFSNIIKQINSSVPSGVKLGGLTINKNQGAVDITATAPDYNSATQLQINLGSKNTVFSKADIVNISCGNNAARSNGCSVTVRALFSKNNSSFKNNPGGAIQ